MKDNITYALMVQGSISFLPFPFPQMHELSHNQIFICDTCHFMNISNLDT